MKCKDCKIWLRRELPNQKIKRKEYYPAGRCLEYRTFTTGEVHCRFGIEK